MFALAPEEGPNRLIIKNAEMRLLVEDTDTAIDRTTQVVADVGGYIISSRVWYEERWGETHKFSTITMGVPVDDFERAMRRLRDLSMQVLDENATGEDVTDEYVDLDSLLKNLEATRDRIREFLAEAKTVQDALKVNEELSKVEEEIEKVQGRMNYLFDRAAYSTITVNLKPAAVMEEYVRRTVRVERLVRRIVDSPVYHRFFSWAPGLRELIVLGKIVVLTEDSVGWSRKPRYDLVIADLPATGHGADNNCWTARPWGILQSKG